MGKASYSPLGQWRNKVGGQVYRVDSGEQIITAYQPVVKNPRTAEQIENRTKFTTATRFIGGFKPFIDVMNPTGGRRAIRATLMKRVLGSMTSTAVSLRRQNGNLVINQTDTFNLILNQATQSGTDFTFTGTVVLADSVAADDFVDETLTVYIGVQCLNETGTVLTRQLLSVPVALSSSREFTFTISLAEVPAGVINGALVEVGGAGALTAEAWARFSRHNAIETTDETSSLTEYSLSNARVFSANVGRGVILTP